MPIGVHVQTNCKASVPGPIEGRAKKSAVTRRILDCFPTLQVAHFFRNIKCQSSTSPFFVGAVIGAFYAFPAATLAAPLSQNNFMRLAVRCAPIVPAVTLEAVARTESGLDPLVLHDNTTGMKEDPGSLELAVAEASQWIGRGDSVDIGLMQINAANLHALGLTVVEAFDPCASLSGGAAVLRAAYGGGSTQAEQQAALLIALSRYNTGTPFQGIMNGYARTVLENAGTGAEALPIPLSPAQTPIFIDPNAPPSWNVSAAGAYAQRHGASWIIDLVPSPGPAGALPNAQRSAATPEQLAAASIVSFSTPPISR